MNEVWPWLLLAGLGAFHGLNPAMGWLFAVALGLHRQSGRVVVRAVPAIAFGHTLSIALIAGLVVATGFLVDGQVVRTAVAAALIGWALWHQIFGHRHRVRFGMQTGLVGLALWSFLMATAHGAGLMVLPAIMPICLTGSPVVGIVGSQTAAVALAAVGVHSLAMLTATGAIAFAVYRWIGLEILRSVWINVDIVWTLVLFWTGILLLLA
jgi:hypothetical protein